MSNTNPARGMRDFLPEQVRKREYVIGVIKSVYEKYGFEPLETPSVENLATLSSKSGDESDQLMYKILKRGEKLQKKLEGGQIRSENELSDLALRYDLTVPLARVIANYRNDLPKFFKRYQIQPVWRADRPAKGRYREFYQCDVDAIGSKSMVVEAELIGAVSEILSELGFKDYEIRLNNRELLFGLLAASGIAEDLQSDAVVSLDKLDKIGAEKVAHEMNGRGVSKDSAAKVLQFFEDLVDKSNEDVIAAIEDFVSNDESLKDAVDATRELLGYVVELNVKLDPSLARGLSYYTGAIIEIVLTSGDFTGSVTGGGRYDGLIGMFGKEQIPAAGLSIGLERLIYVMEERGMFPDDLNTTPADVMVVIWNAETASESLKLAQEIRRTGKRVLVYPQDDKLGKQFKYADQIGIATVCVLGATEIENKTVTIKNLASGDQQEVPRSGISDYFS